MSQVAARKEHRLFHAYQSAPVYSSKIPRVPFAQKAAGD
jgi:hypothetical protein